jgi:hypothetical protein
MKEDKKEAICLRNLSGSTDRFSQPCKFQRHRQQQRIATVFLLSLLLQRPPPARPRTQSS